MEKKAAWFKAVVKDVMSGDSVCVVAGGAVAPGAAATGVPAEKRLTLSSLIAPKMVRRRVGGRVVG